MIERFLTQWQNCVAPGSLEFSHITCRSNRPWEHCWFLLSFHKGFDTIVHAFVHSRFQISVKSPFKRQWTHGIFQMKSTGITAKDYLTNLSVPFWKQAMKNTPKMPGSAVSSKSAFSSLTRISEFWCAGGLCNPWSMMMFSIRSTRCRTPHHPLSNFADTVSIVVPEVQKGTSHWCFGRVLQKEQWFV